MLQRALFSRGAARTVEASPVEEAYAWVAHVPSGFVYSSRGAAFSSFSALADGLLVSLQAASAIMDQKTRLASVLQNASSINRLAKKACGALNAAPREL